MFYHYAGKRRDQYILTKIGPSFWDIGPGHLFVEELGGTLTGARGEVYDYVEEGGDYSAWAGLLCSNRKLVHAKIIEIFREYMISIGKGEGKLHKPGN